MKSLSIIFLVLVFASCQKQQNEEINRAKQASIDSMKTEINRQKVIDSMQLEMAKIEEKKERPQNVTVVNQPASTAVAPAKKKGWSGAAKGAVIGAGVGAATGAIVSEKKGQGAIIGGLVGAGVGAGTGAIIDDSAKNKEK
ncbi:YMGG-like glycine zipper-containing protein [Flavobacterium sp. WC2509]|uniref:YMGG-like glycine zipper-containing protein n=1 Tax=Flavobacterium sp. WC2509 TaxID=3461406 RepID=UPI0040442D07